MGVVITLSHPFKYEFFVSENGSTFRFSVEIPKSIALPEKKGVLDRESFYDWLWTNFGNKGLVGIHEGTLLSEDAATQGFETDSWTVDSAEAPRERDWIGHQERANAELYFSSLKEAEAAALYLKEKVCLEVNSVEEQKPQDWDAQWKASFLNAGEGVKIPPDWRIVPPWVEASPGTDEKWIKINPGAGFGTGTHETTQLCLEALGVASRTLSLDQGETLDFGSGSGILSIGMALLGAKVDAVEIDPLALDNALDNAGLNFVENKISFSREFPHPEDKKYKVIIANILRPVLLEFSNALVKRLSSDGLLILSGLIEKDVDSIVKEYSRLIDSAPIRIYSKGEWRAIVFKK